ncbi:lysoplasmalogenase [Legionella micdadei]|uniref:Putative inner membrane protein n=1 Tax=Legionella micdadei TaxID=451 RepID=A0A098GC03_LEGMI|nr:lysoplasmalogenase [Legionella micdadei]ARG96306.1 lysoplasmalogenase [Legionella micdadei]KTD29130.1 transmembrane protein [Legionella micdadei]NSL19417.1 lysoplasmalogenase [Legionella micdadei]CEG59497.1 putative inner membrane protein [Legionella micdadei]SCX91649.1 Uncharacterized membrane protein YhhN [Legionella micdadei]
MSSQYSKINLALAVLSMLIYLLSLSYIDYPATTILKPLPIVFLILFSLKNHNPEVKSLLLAALSFSLLGDIALTLPLDLALQLAILSFILAQYAYILLFLRIADFQHKRLPTFLAILIFLTIGFYTIYPYLGEMKVPVIVYTCWLIPMIFCALHVKQHTSIVSLGAFLFLFSDLAFAVNQFIFANDRLISILVMYLYYSAQFLLVLGTSVIKNITIANLELNRSPG